MLSFFKKKEKKKKSPVPPFDAKLIKKFHKDHAKLVETISEIESAYAQGKVKDVKRKLQGLKLAILGHFMEEDLKLYWYLKDRYKDDPSTIETVKIFESSIKKIQREVIGFIDRYTQEEMPLDETFKEEFDAIVNALSSRIMTEESNLYTLYLK